MGVIVNLNLAIIAIINRKDVQKFEEKTNVNSCTNINCENHGKEINSNFCSSCGSKVDLVEFKSTGEEPLKSFFYNNDIYLIGEESSTLVFACSTLEKISIFENGEYSYIDSSPYNMSHIVNYKNKNKNIFEQLDSMDISYSLSIQSYTAIC